MTSTIAADRNVFDDASWHNYQITSEESPATAVVTAVAAVTNAPVFEIEPIQSVIDADALNTLVREADDDVRIGFELQGCEVVVTASTIAVRPPIR